MIAPVPVRCFSITFRILIGDTFLSLYPCTRHRQVSYHRKFIIVGKSNLFYEKKSEKNVFTHILAKVYTTPFAGRHFNTAGRMEYVAKPKPYVKSILFLPACQPRTHVNVQSDARTPRHKTQDNEACSEGSHFTCLGYVGQYKIR